MVYQDPWINVVSCFEKELSTISKEKIRFFNFFLPALSNCQKITKTGRILAAFFGQNQNNDDNSSFFLSLLFNTKQNYTLKTQVNDNAADGKKNYTNKKITL